MGVIYFVVVNFFSHEKVAELVGTIPPQEGVKGILVDNSADDVEYAALCDAITGRHDIKCIQADRNGGFSYGTNLGIREAAIEADAYLILNPDTKVEPEFFSALHRLRDAMPDAVISPHGKHMVTGETWSAGGRFHWLRARADVEKKTRSSGETGFGTCACLLVPKAALDEVGELDEDFFLGGEEWDFSLRLRRANWPIIYSPFAVYSHEVSGTHEKYGLRFFYVGMRTKVLFARKHYGVWFWPWLTLVFAPSWPVLLYRNARLQHGRFDELIPLLLWAVLRSARSVKMTEREFRTEGKSV